MTRNDGHREEPALGPTQEPPTTRPDPADITGTWAYVSPIAKSPESYGPAPQDPVGPPNRPPTWGAPVAPDPGGKPPSRLKPWQKVAAGGALAVVVGIGGVAAVTAANASSGDSATTQAGFAGGAPGSDGSGDFGPQGGRGGMAGVMELANALHGDFVVSADSGTQTMRLQTGEITQLSADSLTVTSTDGYVSTYTVGTDVDVSGLASGDTVRVIGTVDGDTATATSVQSGTSGGFGEGGMTPPEGMSAPDEDDQAPQTS